MTAATPHSDPTAFASIVIDGLRSPGTCTLSNHKRVVGWDQQKAKGQSGGRLQETGDEAARFTVTYQLTDQDDFDDWEEFEAYVVSTVRGSKRRTMSIHHPDLVSLNITRVVLAAQIGRVHSKDGDQTVAHEFIEDLPPKAKDGKPGAPASKAKSKAPDPNQAALDELARLTAEYARTPWG